MADKKGFGAVVRREDSYGFYIDKYVEIATQGAVYLGRYRGINDNDDAVLRPFMRRESYPTGKDKEEKREIIFTLIDEPQFINRNTIVSLGGVREGYIHSIIERREIIIPSRE